MVFRSSIYFCQRGYVLLRNLIPGVIIGSPKKPNPRPNQVPLITIAGVIYNEARNIGATIAASRSLGPFFGNGETGESALPNLSQLTIVSAVQSVSMI